MVSRGDQIRKSINGLSAAIQTPRLHGLRMTTDSFQPKTVDNFVIIRLELELTAIDQRLPIRGQVAGTIALVGILCCVEFGCRNEIASVIELGIWDLGLRILWRPAFLH